jgi:hypothetical protein
MTIPFHSFQQFFRHGDRSCPRRCKPPRLLDKTYLFDLGEGKGYNFLGIPLPKKFFRSFGV